MSRWGRIFNLLRNLFVLIGVVACIAGILAVKLALDRYQLTPHQFAVKLAARLASTPHLSPSF